MAGQAAHVVVRFDHMSLARFGARGFDHVRINRALRQPLHVLELGRLLVENLDEHASDDLTLGFRVRFAGERGEEALFGVDAYHPHAHVLGERRHHLIAFAEAQQPMIHEYAGQLRSDGTMQQRRQHRGIDAPGQPQQHFVAAHLGADSRHAVLDDVARRPRRCAAGNLAHEAPQDLPALQRVRHLGMKLQSVQAAGLVGHGRERCVVARGNHAESGRDGDHTIAMAHPYVEHPPARRVAIVLEAVEQARGGRWAAPAPRRIPDASMTRPGRRAAPPWSAFRSKSRGPERPARTPRAAPRGSSPRKPTPGRRRESRPWVRSA